MSAEAEQQAKAEAFIKITSLVEHRLELSSRIAEVSKELDYLRSNKKEVDLQIQTELYNARLDSIVVNISSGEQYSVKPSFTNRFSVEDRIAMEQYIMDVQKETGIPPLSMFGNTLNSEEIKHHLSRNGTIPGVKVFEQLRLSVKKLKS